MTLTAEEEAEQQAMLADLGITEEEFANAQAGRFQHTMLEMWGTALTNVIHSSRAPISIEIADTILRAYPFLTHENVNQYRAARADLAEKALEHLESILGKNKEKIFKETENDWALHQDMYIDVIGGWVLLTNQWGSDWSDEAMESTPNPVTHAAIGDIATMLLDQTNGLMQGIYNLEGFDWSDENAKRMTDLVGEKDE